MTVLTLQNSILIGSIQWLKMLSGSLLFTESKLKYYVRLPKSRVRDCCACHLVRCVLRGREVREAGQDGFEGPSKNVVWAGVSAHPIPQELWGMNSTAELPHREARSRLLTPPDRYWLQVSLVRSVTSQAFLDEVAPTEWGNCLEKWQRLTNTHSSWRKNTLARQRGLGGTPTASSMHL